MKRGRPSHFDKLWHELLVMEVYCQRGMTPNAAAVRVVHERRRPVTGTRNTSAASAVRLLKKYHCQHRKSLRLMIAAKWTDAELALTLQQLQTVGQSVVKIWDGIERSLQMVGAHGVALRARLISANKIPRPPDF